MKCFWSLLILLFATYTAFSQTKFEKEFRISESEVPQSAVHYLSSIQSTKIKWFKEISQDGKSIEAKFKHTDHLFSVEFDTLGNLKDIEVVINTKEVPPNLLNTITDALSSNFESHTFRKLQKQYSGSSLKIDQVLQNTFKVEEATIRYEAIIKGKNDEGVNLYEITFDDTGNLLSKAFINLSNSDHLEY